MTVAVNSFVSDAAKVRRIHRGMAVACDLLLGKIPRDAGLIGTESSVVEQLIAAACSVPGVLVPVATKVLHRKRPALVPMLDNVVLRYYVEHLGRPELIGRSQDKSKAASVATIALQEFKEDLRQAEPMLTELVDRLEQERMPVTTVRLLSCSCGVLSSRPATTDSDASTGVPHRGGPPSGISACRTPKRTESVPLTSKL